MDGAEGEENDSGESNKEGSIQRCDEKDTSIPSNSKN